MHSKAKTNPVETKHADNKSNVQNQVLFEFFLNYKLFLLYQILDPHWKGNQRPNTFQKGNFHKYIYIFSYTIYNNYY